MAINDSSTEQKEISVIKKPYEKPSFRYEKVFVTTALSCGKVGGSQACMQQASAS